MFATFFSRWKWRWVGTVKADCQLVDERGAHTPGGSVPTYWNLYERGDGKRRFETIGRPEVYRSASVLSMDAAVKAWKLGGPKPTALASQPPAPKPKAKLIAFPGGKDGAA